tara:strand:+ start:14001 stop:14333 length:333 start_codon:yes stop_codon:yes gene_type:complete
MNEQLLDMFLLKDSLTQDEFSRILAEANYLRDSQYGDIITSATRAGTLKAITIVPGVAGKPVEIYEKFAALEWALEKCLSVGGELEAQHYARKEWLAQGGSSKDAKTRNS